MPVRAARRLRRPAPGVGNVDVTFVLDADFGCLNHLFFSVIDFVECCLAVWFWITLLGVGFVGLLYTFRLTQRRVRLERRAKERQEKKKSRRLKR